MSKPFQLRGFGGSPGELTPDEGIVVRKHIRDRTNSCFVLGCWLLSDPSDTGRMFLPRKYFIDEPVNRKGRYITIKQYLYQIVYGKPVPAMTKIVMRCGEKRCINPAHYYLKGHPPTYDAIQDMILKRWISREQARVWYEGKEAEEEPPAPNLEQSEADKAINHKREGPSWEDVYPGR